MLKMDITKSQCLPLQREKQNVYSGKKTENEQYDRTSIKNRTVNRKKSCIKQKTNSVKGELRKGEEAAATTSNI